MKRIHIALGIILSLFILRSANALCVSAQKANLRVGPSTNYGIVWEVYKFMPFLKVGVSLSGEWYAVKDIDGDVNWIHKRLLTDKYRCAVLKKEEVNVRTGPGKNYSKSLLSPARKYYSFRVLRIKGPWVKVKDDRGGVGWIYRNFLWIQ
jgi:SH3-like domain-containing protein